jgi:hypothetical protein
MRLRGENMQLRREEYATAQRGICNRAERNMHNVHKACHFPYKKASVINLLLFFSVWLYYSGFMCESQGTLFSNFIPQYKPFGFEIYSSFVGHEFTSFPYFSRLIASFLAITSSKSMP